MKKISLYLQAALYVAAGINHFINSNFYLPLMPPWLPLHMPLVVISGAAEIMLGIFLIPRVTRRSSAWLIIAMLIVFLLVIHIPMTIDYYKRHDPALWITLVRLPLQFVLIWWAFIYTKAGKL